MAKEKEVITRQAVRQVLREYLSQYKTHWLMALIGFLFPAVGTILVFFVPPLIIEKLINFMVEEGKISVSAVSNYIVWFAVLWMLGEIFWRIGLHFLIKLEAKALKNLGTLAFRRLTS